jgi:hypothetical protein
VIANTPKNSLEKHFIGHSDGPGEFSISYSRGKGGLPEGKDNFGDYTILPVEEWGSIKLYKKFKSKSYWSEGDIAKRGVVQDVSYSEGDFVYVRPAYPDPEDGVERDF